MAPSAKHFTLIILVISLTLSFHVHARDSQFFSKVTSTNNENTQEVKVLETPNKEEPLKTQENNGQNFVQDSQNGYGLWGHEAGQNPPSTAAKTTTPTTANNEAFVADPQGTASTKNSNNNNGVYVADPKSLSGQYEYPNNYNNEAYVTNPQGMSDERFTQKGYTTGSSSSNNNNNYYNNNGAYVTDPQGSSNNYNTEAYVTNPQGMSDTRFSNQWYTPDSSNNNNNNNYYNTGAYVADPERSSGTLYKSNKYPSNYNNEAYVTNPRGYSSSTSRSSSNNNNYYYDNDAYVADPLGSSGTSFEEKRYTNTNNKNYYNGVNNYDTQRQGMSDTRFMENGKYYYDPKGENNYPSGYNYNSGNNNYDNGVKRYTTQQYDTSLMGNSYNTQKQGMSDTRFLENGKYYYDPKSENNYGHGYGNMRGVNYHNQGYNGNSYEEKNSMGGYQNQEFEDNQEEEYLP